MQTVIKQTISSKSALTNSVESKDSLTSDIGAKVLESRLSDSLPRMDGSVSVGTSRIGAREDHVHPSDTSRAPADLSALPNLADVVDFRNTANVYACNNGVGYRLSIAKLKELNTKIVVCEEVQDADKTAVAVGDFIYTIK